MLSLSFTWQRLLGKVYCLKCAFMASYKGEQLCEAISRSLKTNLEALFKEIELFRDCSLITII